MLSAHDNHQEPPNQRESDQATGRCLRGCTIDLGRKRMANGIEQVAADILADNCKETCAHDRNCVPGKLQAARAPYKGAQ